MRRLLLIAVLLGSIALVPTPASADPVGYTQTTIAGEDRIYEVDVASGAMTELGDSGLAPAARAMVLAGDGTLYGSNNGSLYTYDRTTGVATLVGAHGCCSIMEAMTFDTAGRLWGLSGNPSQLYQIDPSTGAATQVGPTNGHLLSGLAAACDGTVYATDGPDDNLITIDTSDGSTAVVGPLGFDVGLGSLAFDAGGTLWMMVRPASPPGTASRTFTVNTGTGALTQQAAAVAGNNPVSLALGPQSCTAPPSTTSATPGSTSSTTPASTSSTTGAGPSSAATVTPAFTG